MIKLAFRGYSDDTFGEVNHFHIDYDNCATDKPIEYLVYNDEYALLVTGWYGMKNHTGNWMIGVSNYSDSDNKACDWDISISRSEAYDYEIELVIEAPDDVKVELFNG